MQYDYTRVNKKNTDRHDYVNSDMPTIYVQIILKRYIGTIKICFDNCLNRSSLNIIQLVGL